MRLNIADAVEYLYIIYRYIKTVLTENPHKNDTFFARAEK